MDPRRFDRISKLFANRRLSRRQAIATGGAGLATLATGPIATAQDATPDAETVPGDAWSGEKTTYLFVQSFHGGSITPTDDVEGRYTVTLNQGTGQTISFGDRPSRDVGVTDTPEFLEGLGFSDDNPPNAALIVETESGETDIAVVELFNPTYDPETRGVTYEVEVLDAWQEDLDLGLREEPNAGDACASVRQRAPADRRLPIHPRRGVSRLPIASAGWHPFHRRRVLGRSCLRPLRAIRQLPARSLRPMGLLVRPVRGADSGVQ